jgi:hypothetical protein
LTTVTFTPLKPGQQPDLVEQPLALKKPHKFSSLPTQPRRSPRTSPPTKKKADTEWKSTDRRSGKKKGKASGTTQEPIPFILPPLPQAKKIHLPL